MLNRFEWRAKANELWGSPVHRAMFDEWLGLSSQDDAGNVKPEYYNQMFCIWSALYMGENK